MEYLRVVGGGKRVYEYVGEVTNVDTFNPANNKEHILVHPKFWRTVETVPEPWKKYLLPNGMVVPTSVIQARGPVKSIVEEYNNPLPPGFVWDYTGK